MSRINNVVIVVVVTVYDIDVDSCMHYSPVFCSDAHYYVHASCRGVQILFSCKTGTSQDHKQMQARL